MNTLTPKVIQCIACAGFSLHQVVEDALLKSLTSEGLPDVQFDFNNIKITVSARTFINSIIKEQFVNAQEDKNN